MAVNKIMLLRCFIDVSVAWVTLDLLQEPGLLSCSLLSVFFKRWQVEGDDWTVALASCELARDLEGKERQVPRRRE